MNTMEVLFIAGLAAGIVGSLHCIGMCGPLALAIPMGNKGPGQRFFVTVLHGLGKTASYTTLGALFGLLGKSIQLMAYQQLFSILAGILLLFSVVFVRYFHKINILYKPMSKLSTSLMVKLLKTESGYMRYMAMGAANGLLPCGLVYAALIVAAASGSVTGGVISMLGFGMGTYPTLATIMLLGAALPPIFRLRIRVLSPYFIAFAAVLLILRGSNLGIPYISPDFNTTNTAHNCCHK